MLETMISYAKTFGRQGTKWVGRGEAVYYPVSWVQMKITQESNGRYLYTETVYGRVVVSASGVSDVARAWREATHRWAK